jgi:hypothetical protein
MSSGLIVETQGLGQPKALLDGFSVPLPPGIGQGAAKVRLRDISASAAAAAALAAFTEGRYLVTINGRQCADMDETVRVGVCSRVRFVRLVPLTGG